MLLILFVCLIPHAVGKNFDYPIGGFERADPINPQLFFPCLQPIYDLEYGKFDPLLFVGYPVTLPPIASCPEIVNKETVRFLAISRKNPTIITSVKKIPQGSKVAIFFHSFLTEYDSLEGIAVAMATLRENDWVVLVDWSRLADLRAFGRIRIPFINLFLIQANAILVGRISCKFVKFLIKEHGVQAEDMFLLGFSSAAGILGFLADYCRNEYKIHFNHMLGMDMFAIPYRRSSYALTNHTSAKFFDAIFTTISPNIPGLDEAAAFLGKEGYFEVVADCAYYVNPEIILNEQPPCVILPGPTFCSHFFSVVVFLSAYSGRCLYRYGPCPETVGVSSNQQIGLTKLNCADHPFLRRTCITTSANPLKTC